MRARILLLPALAVVPLPGWGAAGPVPWYAHPPVHATAHHAAVRRAPQATNSAVPAAGPRAARSRARTPVMP
jgi:hypothetical protein